MSPNLATFLDLCLRGECLPDEIDDYVDLWHTGDSTLPLSEFLGILPEEYALWVEMPSALEWILQSRRTGKPISSVLADIDPENAKVGASSLSPHDADALSQWLRRMQRL